jgi:hypothetical protein
MQGKSNSCWQGMTFAMSAERVSLQTEHMGVSERSLILRSRIGSGIREGRFAIVGSWKNYGKNMRAFVFVSTRRESSARCWTFTSCADDVIGNWKDGRALSPVTQP